MIKSHQDYVAFLKLYLGDHIDAFNWVIAYSLYVHAIDDIIDDEIPKDKETRQFMLAAFEFAEVVYTNMFYLQNIDRLRPLIKMASNTYMDSVELELSKEKWKIDCADQLRHTGSEIILACIEIVAGLNKRREASMPLRELYNVLHHTEEGLPC